MTTVTRYHDISAGHRVYGHEGACKHLHGHNYRIHFKVCGGMDEQGRVIDFSVIKETLCMWLEDNWDHKMILFDQDPIIIAFQSQNYCDVMRSVVVVPFNPTAENLAKHLVEVVGPEQLKYSGCVLIECTVEETRKCSATYTHRAWAGCVDMSENQLGAIYAASEYAPGGPKYVAPTPKDPFDLDDLPF